MNYVLPEPDYELMGTNFGPLKPAEINRYHADWHRENPDRSCERGGFLVLPVRLGFADRHLAALSYGLVLAVFGFVGYIVWLTQ